MNALPGICTETELQDFFQTFGDVLNITIQRNVDGSTKGRANILLAGMDHFAFGDGGRQQLTFANRAIYIYPANSPAASAAAPAQAPAAPAEAESTLQVLSEEAEDQLQAAETHAPSVTASSEAADPVADPEAPAAAANPNASISEAKPEAKPKAAAQQQQPPMQLRFRHQQQLHRKPFASSATMYAAPQKSLLPKGGRMENHKLRMTCYMIK